MDGVTIHRLFQLWPQRDTGQLRYSPLSREFVKKMMNEFRDMKLLICDECSMVSNILLYLIHLRLEEIFAEQRRSSGGMTEMEFRRRIEGSKYDVRNSLGGQNVLLTGDFMQLEPVNAKHCFKALSNADIQQAGGGLPLKVNLLDQFTFFELLENMRQGDDFIWAEMLERFRIGNVTDEDARMLFSRVIRNFNELLPC